MGNNNYSFTPLCRGGQGSFYEQFHVNVKGAGQLHDTASILDDLSSEYGQHQQDLTTALRGIRATYTGNAAEQMQGAFDPLIKSLGDGQAMATAAANTLTTQGGHFATAQSKIANTVPVPGQPFYEHWVPWDTGYDDAMDKNNDINSATNAAVKQYNGDTSTNAQSLPAFSAEAPYTTSGMTVTSGQQQTSGGGYAGTGGYGGGPAGAGGFVPHSVAPSYGGSGSVPYQHARSGQDQGQGQGGGQGQQVGSGGPYSGTAVQGYNGGVPAGGVVSGAGGGGGGYGDVGGFGPGGFAGGFAGGFGGGDSVTSGRGYGAGGYGAGGYGGDAEGGPGAGSTSGVGGAAAAERAVGGAGVRATAGQAGAAGANGMAGGGQGRGGRGEEDYEHRTASYLVTEENGNEIVGDLPPTLPAGGLIGG